MTSTNDGKDVKSNQISGPKSKTYFIELYKSLDARLSGECSAEERTRLVCQSWRRVHSLCQHSAPTTQLHLINWLQQHTAHTILQTEWQSPKSKEQHTWLERAIDEFIQECRDAISKRDGGWSPPWEHQLQLRALWFKSTLPNPWGHGVLKALLDLKGPKPSDDEVLEWLKLERGVMFVTRLRQLAASKCDDLALLLATAVMDKMRAATVIVSDVEQAEAKGNPELLTNKESAFVNSLREGAGFTEEVWMLITDIEFVLLYKGELRSRCIELAKQTPLLNGYQLVKRLHTRLEKSPRDKKLWKNAKEAATLVAQVVIARCMVVPRCWGAARGALAGCAGLLALMLAPERLRTAAAALAAPAATSRHLYTLAEAVHDRCKEERTPFVCELYVRAITAGMNELERLKIKTEKESEARATEKTLSSWFSKLGGLLSGSRRLYCECILTAFSVHPSPAMYERVQAAPALAPLKTDIQETNEEANSEYGSWATDSRTQTNLVKTSETLNLKKTQKQANVLSTAIFAEGEALGLGAELCQDLAVLISGPRIKTLSWDTDRGALLESCAVYCERTRGGTRALTTELRFLNLDPRCFQHLPEERDDDGDLYYGIEKGYEHLVDLHEPEEIWQDAASDDGDKSDGAAMDSPLAVLRRKQHKTKPLKYSSDEEPLSLEAIAKSSQKKERPHSKERRRERKDKKHKAKVKQEPKDEGGEIDQGSEKQKKKKERKERKKKEKDKDTPQTPVARPSGSLSRLVGMKVAGLSSLNSAPERRADGTVCVTDSDYDSQGKSSIASLNSEGNDPDVLFDGLFSMEETKSPEKNVNDNIQRANVNKMEELSLSTATKYQKSQSPNYQTPLLSSNVSHVKEEVKNSIKKLIEFRRYKNITDDPSTRTLNTQRIIYDQQQQQQSPHNKTPVTIINTHTPKVFIHKEQIKQLHVFKDEVNNILQSTSLGKDSNGVNEAAERSLPPNTITKRPNEKAKISGYKSSASRKIEQPLQLHESMSVANPRELLEKDKRAAESSQYNHQEIIKHLEKGPSKIVFPDILKALPCNRADQPLQKSETVIHNMYQSGPQHVSNASPVSLHAKVASTNRGVSQSPHHQHHRLVVHKHDPGQRQFHNFLKDLQVSINAGATNDKQDRKTFPAQTNSKQTLQQKKPDNVPNTFARMSYLKNKQTDFKLKSTEKTMQNKSVHVAPIENLQHLHSKGGIFISKIDKTKHPTSIERDKIKLENRENKLKVKKETIDAMNSHKISTPLSIVKKHPTMSNMLSSGSEKHVPNTSSVSNLKCFETMQPEAPEQTSFLSEKDQDDMLQLLRQQSLLNSMKGQHKTHIQKSSTDSVTILNNKTPSIVNPIRRPSVSASNIKINKPTSEPKCSNEKPLPNSTLKISNTKPTSASHSKKRNIKETTKNSKDASKQSDWESVMNALLATKTPSRVSQSGPNALDIALDKDSFDRCYSSNAMSQTQRKINSSVITETTKSNSAISTQKPICDITETAAAKGGENCEIKSKDREYASSSKSQTITRLLKVSKPVLKPKPIFIENHLDLAKRHTFQGPGKPLPSVIQNRNDPFISGIKNSDYDLLEELMDDDLRQEIGELSDEEPYDASPPNMTKKNNPALNKSLYVQQQRPIEPFDHTYKLTDLNYKDSVRCQNVLKPMVHGKKCTLSKSNSDVKLRITSNEVISSGNINNNVNYFPVINDTGATVRNSNEVKNNLNLTPKKTNVYTQQQNNKISPIVVDPDSSVKIDDQTTNININKVQNSHLNILDPTRVVLTVPPRNAQPNVMLIDNDFIYDSLSTVNLEQNVNGAASNYNHNTYIAVNQVPKVTVYRATQFATSIRSPVLIEKSIVFPASKNDNNVAAEVAQLTSSSIVHGEISDSLISPNKLKTDRRNDVPGREQTFSKYGNELLSEPTNIKLTNKDDANQRTSVCNILLNDNSPEIFQKTQEHNTSSTDKKNCSISHIPTSVIVSSDNYGTINSSHLGSKIDNEKPSMCPQNTIRDSPPQKDKIVKEDSTNTDTPIVFHLKDIQSSDIKVSQIENVNKQNTSANQHHSRTYLKRLRILNREIEHRCRVEPIVLSYEPIKSKQNEEVNSDKVESPLLGPSIAAPKNLELAKSTCRRILLRSSNSLNVTKSLSKGKSKFIDVRMGQARVKHKSTPYSKQCNDEFQKNDAAHLTETSNTKKEYIRSPQPISEGVVKSIDDIKDTEKLNVLNDKNENNIDSCNTSSVAENMETSVTPVVKINESKLPLQKEIAGCDTQDKQSNYITEYNASDTPKKKELQTSTEDITEVDTNTLNGQSEEIKSISMQYQISTNNNNIIKCVSGTSTSDQNQNIKDEFNEKIFFEELPNLSNDKSKRYIRIKLRNDSFKASISGKVNVNIDAILEDPSIKSMLMEKMNCNTKCILNIKQIAVPSKNRPSVIKTPIQDVSYVVKDDLETINLISDDDEDLTQNFETEFGIFKIATMNPNLFTKHQNKFSQRCEVRIESSKLKKNKVSHTVEENVTNSTTSVENICVTSLEIPKNIVDYIEIDDSSNESISLMSNLDCALVNNSLGETKLNDLVTNNISQNITESEPHLVNSKIPQTCESSQNISEVEIKDCSLKIEKCDKLIKQYEQLKIKNKKCFVNLVRCDSSQHYRMKTEEVSDLKSTEELNQLSDILHADEEISETCEQSLKRVDSVSILNDLLIFEEEGSSVPVHPSSPVPSVIESDMYTTLTANADTFSENNSVIDFLPLHCFADWMMTKSKSRVMEPESNESKLMPFGLEKTHVIADDISTDCDSDRESNSASDKIYYEKGNYEKERDIFHAPSLVKITVDFFANNIHIIESLKPTQTSCKFQNVLLTRSLKRKLNDFKGNRNYNKISKLENKSTVLDSDKLKELVIRPEYESVKNKPESLKNICGLYYVKIFNRYKVKSAAPAMNCNKQDEHHENKNESNLLTCDITEQNITTKALGTFEPIESVIGKAFEEKRSNFDENKYMNMLDCDIEQNENVGCVNLSMVQEMDLDITKPLANAASGFKCQDGGINNSKSDNTCIELQITSQHIEKDIQKLNYAIEAKNTLDYCYAKKDENIKLFGRNKILTSETFISNKTILKENPDKEFMLEIPINRLISPIKDDFSYNIEMDKKNVATSDVIVNKNDERKVDVPSQKLSSDHSSEALIHSNIKLQINKNFESNSNINDDQLNIEKESTTSLTVPTTEYFSRRNSEEIYNLSHNAKLEEDNIDNQLNIDIKLYNSLPPQNHNRLCNTHNDESVILTVDIKQKEADSSDDFIHSDKVITNSKENHQKLDININYPCSNENSNLLYSIRENAINIKSLDFENEQIKENEVELAKSLEKTETEIIEPSSAECNDKLKENLSVTMPLEDLEQINNLNGNKLMVDKIVSSPCSSQVYDICNKEGYNDSDCPDLIIPQFKSDEAEKVIPPEEIIDPSSYDNKLDKTNYDQRETTVEINHACIYNKDKISPEESLISFEINPVPPLEKTDIMNIKNVEKISIPESVGNKCDINVSNSLEKVNIKSDTNDSELETYEDIENKTNVENDYVSNKLIQNNRTVSIKLNNEKIRNNSLTSENNNIVDKKEPLSKIADLGVETNNENNILQNENSCLTEINKIDLNQKHIFDVLHKISKEKVVCNKHVKYENNIVSEKPKQKNVTLLYKGESRVELEGSIYEDPVVGTCYVFPILNNAFLPEDILNNVSNDKSTGVLQRFKSKIMKDKEDNKIDDKWVNFNALPKITYLKRRLKQGDINEQNLKQKKRNLKRKIDFTDTKQHAKKYRKGKNIDYSKLTSINDSAYTKEYKRLFDYYNSITFSYSRPFHIEHIDVSNLLKSWPIRGITVDNTDQTDFKNLLFIDEDIYKDPHDPLHQTFSEEISNCNNQQYTCSNIIENNFSMGFGEGSDRVIHVSKNEDNILKFSAATLSDVKQAQPFLMSNHYEAKMGRTQKREPHKEQKEVFKRYLNYIQLKEKVRTFFQNTTVELNESWLTDNKIKSNKYNINNQFPYELTCPDYIRPVPFQCVVQVVQVGQLPVSAAQNPVTCDPRVTQVTDASPSQCSGENSPHDSQSPIKTEYTELTTADISLPLVQEYERHIEAQESSKVLASLDNIPVETEIKTEIKDEISDFENDQNDCNENNVLQTLVNKHINNIEYPYESTDCTETLHTQKNSETQYEQEIYNDSDFIPDQKQHSSTPEKTDQIAHAMNAAGITTTSDAVSNSRTLVNVMSPNIAHEIARNDPPSPNNISKATINSMTLQQALAQILPPPLNPTSQENNQSSTNPSLSSQVLHIVQGKNSNSNQMTLVDNSQNSVISNSNTPMLHIVQNKGSHTNSTSNTNAGQHTNTFGGLSLVDSSLQGNSQLLHIVNTGSQKNSTSGQLLKRVNLLTNLTNTQGSNEQKMVQFVCKSADGKSIQLNSPHQRSMVLRLQPIESNIQNSPKPTDCQELSPVTNGNNSSPIKEGPHTQHEIKSRSVYEENYAKFIQSSNKSAPEKSTTLPKFNQAFGKQVFQDNNQKANDLNSNNSHLSINSSESSECQGTDNAINIDHIGQISSPPLLLRKSPAQASQTQSNLVQQIKQTIAPMNIQTMHGGVIYTRQIPVNIGGGQTINLITVPSTELLDNDNQKPSGDVKFINQSDTEPPIIKIVPHTQNNSSGEGSTEESNSHAGTTNENGQSTPTQHQPVLTQMRIKLPMLSKTPQMVSGTRVVRPSFFQIQRNVIGGANQPVYQQLVLTAAPPLSQHIRLPQAQTTRQVKVSSDGQSSSESQMSTSTLEQLREFDMVLEQVKERSTVQPNTIPNNAFAKLHESSLDTTDGSSVTSTVTESTQQVLYSIGNNQSLNVAYVNRKPNPTFVRSPDSSGIIDSPSSSTHIQIPHTVTSESTSNDVSTQPSQPKAAKIGSKSKSRPKSSSNSSNSMKMNAVPPKTSTQKPLEDEQTTQRILYILAEYKEQVENSPDKDKPAPRRRSNPPSNPGSSKRKKSSSGSRRSGMRDMSPVHGEDTCRTMGSEDSSCGTSQGDCNDSCMDSHSPQDSPRKVVRKLTFDSEATTASQPRPQPQRNVIVADGQTITVARGTSGKPTTAVLMPANYILPVSMVKGGQQIAIVTNRGPKILTVGGGEGGTTNALLLQRLIGPAGLKPVLARPGVRHVRLPTAALHNLQTFNLATATFQPPDSTASPAAGSTPPELIETRANSSPWTDRDSQEVKPERGSSPEDAEPWNLPSSADPHDYSYEETVRTDNMDRTVLDAIPDRYSPDMEAQRIFDKMFDVDSKRSYIIDSQDDSRCAYDIDASDCDDKAYPQVVQRRDARPHRFAHVTHAAAMRHKYAILEHELRLQGSIFSQKSLSEECEDLGVDSPSASELFPEAELLFGNSPAHDAQQHSHTPQPTVLSQCGIPQPDIDDQIATDHLLQHDGLDDQQDLGVTLGLDEGIVTVSEDGMQATIALDQEEFARSHPNTTFHSEPTEDGEIQPFIMAGLKGRHITSTVFHATRAPATVLVSAPPASGPAPPRPSPADLVLTDTRELHLSGHATQVIRRVCWDRRDSKFSVDEPGAAGAGDEAKMAAEDSSRDAAPESPPADDGASSPERHAELFWESNSTSERSEGRRPLDFSSDSEKCCKSPSYDETNSTDSGGVGAHVRLDSVIKDARGVEAGGSADGSSAEDAQPPVRTYPPKRAHRAHDAHDADERSVTGKTRAGERAVRRRASGRGVVKRACQCCGGDPAPLRTKKARQRKSVADFAPH